MLILTIIFYFCIIFISPRNLNAKKKSKGKDEKLLKLKNQKR